MARKHLLAPALAMTLGLALSATEAQAQDEAANSFLSTTSTSTTTSAVTTGGVIITVYLMTPDPNANAALALYLQENAAQVRQDAALGGGPSAGALASAFGASTQRAAFAALLRRERVALASVWDGQARVTPARASALAHHLQAAMARDPALREAAAGLLTR